MALGAREVQLFEGKVRAWKDGDWKDLFRVPFFIHTQLANHIKNVASIQESNEPEQGQARVTVRGQEAIITVIVKPSADGPEEVTVLFPESP